MTDNEPSADGSPAGWTVGAPPGLPRSDPLSAVSPLDGRYAGRTAELAPYASEAGLMRARIHVEAAYLRSLAEVEATPIELSDDERAAVRDAVESFDGEDARLVKRLETEGAHGYEATNHDVKAIEYFLRLSLSADERVDNAQRLFPWIHFGLTSEDVNNLAYRLLVRGAVVDVLLPAVRKLRDRLADMAHMHRDVPMLARTHGQPATPTTFGKEMAVYAARVRDTEARIVASVESLEGKLAGASGTYAAHHAAYPDVDWRTFSRTFVESLGFEHRALTTQVNPCDDLASLFDAIRGANNVFRDLALDAWLYIADRYLGQEAANGETGSSTMPHKVNPIDFENAEGNLSKANSDLTFLADYITTSRLQRDLSDSTVKRNVGAAMAHCTLAYSKLDDGLATVKPNEQVMREELAGNPEVIGEAVQTILRREGDTEAYERVKELTRGRRTSLEAFRDLFEELDIDDSVRQELRALTPEEYTGLGTELAEEPD